MRILFLGDIVGTPGVDIVVQTVPRLIQEENLALVIANAENASGGSGMVPGACRRLRQAGVDAITMGDHLYKRLDILKVIEQGEPICKPANFPADAPGQEFLVVPARNDTPVGVVSLLGRLFMRPVDCPFQAVDRVLAKLKDQTRCVIVDMHAEATGDKALMGRYLDGRVSAVLGTHTHVPTADEQIFPGGTAFISDVGMCGPYESILGRRIDRVLYTTTTFVPSSFDVATGDPRLSGVIVDVDPETGKATAIRRIMIRDTRA